MSGRIDPKSLRAAAVRLNIRPRSDIYASVKYGERCGCGMTIAYMDRLGQALSDAEFSDLSAHKMIATLGLSHNYATGFIRGFDGHTSTMSGSANEQIGLQDGSAARKELGL